MTQVIGVTYLSVSTPFLEAWHLALFYDGAGNKKVRRRWRIPKWRAIQNKTANSYVIETAV
jgi:hypothetical protein